MTSKYWQVPATLAACTLTLVFAFSPAVSAEDLSDNAVCLECHADEPRAASAETDKPAVHSADGGFTVEDHEMWSCTDCHESVTELPHPDDFVSGEVNCENCHEGTPDGE